MDGQSLPYIDIHIYIYISCYYTIDSFPPSSFLFFPIPSCCDLSSQLSIPVAICESPSYNFPPLGAFGEIASSQVFSKYDIFRMLEKNREVQVLLSCGPLSSTLSMPRGTFSGDFAEEGVTNV